MDGRNGDIVISTLADPGRAAHRMFFRVCLLRESEVRDIGFDKDSIGRGGRGLQYKWIRRPVVEADLELICSRPSGLRTEHGALWATLLGGLTEIRKIERRPQTRRCLSAYNGF